MLVKIEDKGSVEKQLFFSVDKFAVEKEISSFVRDITPRVEVKGFRKGTAPPSVIRNHYNDIILSECSARIVHEVVSSEIRAKNLKIVGSPILIEAHRASRSKKHVGEFNLDGSFEFAVLADFEPELTVKIPDKLVVSEKLPSTDELVEQDLQKVRASMAQLEFVERPATKEDQVSLEFSAPDNNHATVVIGEPEELLVDNSVLVGKSAGDDVEVVLKDGRVASVKITAVFARSLPEINDDFAKSAMYESLDDMKRDLASKRTGDHALPLKAKLYAEILEQLISANPIDIPERWIDAETEVICKRIGVKSISSLGSQVSEQLRTQARKNLCSNIILDAIYRDNENIHMSADEVFGIVEREASRIGRSTDEVLTHLRNTGQYENLMSFHERNRTIDYLISQSTVEQEKV